MRRHIHCLQCDKLLTSVILTIVLLVSLCVSARAELPPRHTTDTDPATASINLYAPAAPLHAWTAVQWQDMDGEWHTVEGWQGTLDEEYRISWWLGEEHFGQGPFRWLIFDNEGGEMLFRSQTFYMPSHRLEEIHVAISPLDIQ